MKPVQEARATWYAVRQIPMPDGDERGTMSNLLWMERRAGGLWAVGRASDLAQRQYSAPRENDYLFVGYELDDALRVANEALEDELEASERDGIHPDAAPFTRKELQAPLNEWFWGRRTA